jgi:hypothetical protein
MSSIEDASIALQMDGVPFGGRSLSIHRPIEYAATTFAASEDTSRKWIIPVMLPLKEASKVVPETKDNDRILMGNIPTGLSEEDVRALVGAFGDVKQLYMVIIHIDASIGVWFGNNIDDIG